MNIALRRSMTVDEYLAWSDSQSERRRTELINGQIVTMPAEKLLHTSIKTSVFLALRQAIIASGLPCKALPDGPGVRIDEHTVYEPDALVYCGASVAHYLIVDPDARTVTHHQREGTANVLHEGPVRLDPPGLNLTVEDLLGAA
jgi:Uma2 family endonuclease